MLLASVHRAKRWVGVCDGLDPEVIFAWVDGARTLRTLHIRRVMLRFDACLRIVLVRSCSPAHATRLQRICLVKPICLHELFRHSDLVRSANRSFSSDIAGSQVMHQQRSLQAPEWQEGQPHFCDPMFDDKSVTDMGSH